MLQILFFTFFPTTYYFFIILYFFTSLQPCRNSWIDSKLAWNWPQPSSPHHFQPSQSHHYSQIIRKRKKSVFLACKLGWSSGTRRMWWKKSQPNVTIKPSRTLKGFFKITRFFLFLKIAFYFLLFRWKNCKEGVKEVFWNKKCFLILSRVCKKVMFLGE